jgi:hypothetical protein
MATTNSYRPTVLSFNSYGWKGAPQYNRADVPTRWAEGATNVDRTVLEQQLAYEWLASEPSGANPMGGYGMATNPPFTKGSAGRVLPGLLASDGRTPRILRGFIRRSEYDVSDATSMARLYFMYNPETITRDYVSYLDQGALDPFNTIYQSGNLVAPPSIMDFTFSLLFDRQEEAMQADFPGVFVDYKFFDLVVRNVVPSNDVQMNASLPDNGVMMVNPRDITVVFSPQITVQGRPSNARVQFTKFTHRMVPIRMQIDLTVRVVYFGPMRDPIPYTRDTEIAAAAIPWREDMGATFEIKDEDIKEWIAQRDEWARGVDASITNALGPAATEAANQWEHTATGSAGLNDSIMKFAMSQVQAANSQGNYSAPMRNDLWTHHDCSSFVWGGFAFYQGADPSYAEDMKWNKPNRSNTHKSNADDSDMMLKKCLSRDSPVTMIWGAGTGNREYRRKWIEPNYHKMQPGDLVFRSRTIGSDTQKPHGGKGHVGFFHHWDGEPGGDAWTVDSAGPGIDAGVPRKISKEYMLSDYNHCYRPNLVGKDMVANSDNGSGAW